MNPIEVLIVEDNLKISKAHKIYVEKVSGYTVIGIANSIKDAEQLIEVLQPQLILLDIYFPESNGMVLLDIIRSKHASIDVILITAAKEVDILHNALRGGVFDYMIKPVFFERFEESLINYRLHSEKLSHILNVSQDKADQFFQVHQDYRGLSSNIDLPKGIDPLTLQEVTQVFDSNKSLELNSQEVGKMIGVSRTTARKYLEYLISTGFLDISLEYGTIGRPERRYKLL